MDNHRRNAVLAAISLINEYYETIICKNPCMSSVFSGDKWVGELLHGAPRRFHNIFRMSPEVFVDLLATLQTSHHLQGSSRITSREVLGMTLYILSHNESIRATCERFQHSSETVSRYFSIGLESLVSLSTVIIKPVDHSFRQIPQEISHDCRYMPYFKVCFLALQHIHLF